jgi:hypothetical protein
VAVTVAGLPFRQSFGLRRASGQFRAVVRSMKACMRGAFTSPCSSRGTDFGTPQGPAHYPDLVAACTPVRRDRMPFCATRQRRTPIESRGR